jgi:hypothetical protein
MQEDDSGPGAASPHCKVSRVRVGGPTCRRRPIRHDLMTDCIESKSSWRTRSILRSMVSRVSPGQTGARHVRNSLGSHCIPGLRGSLGLPRPGLVWRRARNQNDTQVAKKPGYTNNSYIERCSNPTRNGSTAPAHPRTSAYIRGKNLAFGANAVKEARAADAPGRARMTADREPLRHVTKSARFALPGQYNDRRLNPTDMRVAV